MIKNILYTSRFAKKLWDECVDGLSMVRISKKYNISKYKVNKFLIQYGNEKYKREDSDNYMY